MSLADDAKILLIPSGYKTDTPNGKLYSVFPTDGNQDFRIDRATTGTRINPGGLIETMLADTPRLNHYGGNCPSVLREVGRTNLMASSQDFNYSGYSRTRCTVDSTNLIAPDGTLTGNKIESTNTSVANIREFLSITAGSDFSMSFFVKKGTGTHISTGIFNSSSNSFVRYFVDLETMEYDGSLSEVGSEISLISRQIIDYGNGWNRIITNVSTNTTTGLNIYIYPQTNGTTFASTIGEYNYFWGWQTEQGIGATSYIKTTTASVTRNLDNINCENETYETGNDVTWFLDFDSYTFTNSFRPLIVIRNSGFTETMDWISYNSGSDYYFRMRVTNQSSLQTIIAFGQNAIQMFQRNKVALRLYGSNYEIYVNGVREYTGTSTNGDWKIINNSAILNDFGSHSEAPSMKLYDFRVYDKTMTQSDLETLTTL